MNTNLEKIMAIQFADMCINSLNCPVKDEECPFKTECSCETATKEKWLEYFSQKEQENE